MADTVSSRRITPDVQHASKKLEIGLIGLVFGDASEKPGNIAAMAIVLAFISIICLFFFVPENSNAPFKEAVTLLGGVITGALGFLFGRSTR